MSNTEKKIIVFLIVAFVVGNIVLFVKKEKIKRDFSRYRIEEVVSQIEVNRATKEELEILPGIGPVLAQRIIDYRERNGKFQKFEDLLKVEGVTHKILGQIKGLITLE